MKRVTTLFLLATLALSTVACACCGGGIGPRGGVHPAHCWIW
jgi:hypothetical protein